MSAHAPRNVSSFLLLCLVTLLTGCASNVLVERQALSDLEEREQQQSDRIMQLETALHSHHRGLVLNNNDNTRALIDTIRDQIKPPVCPQTPQPSCSGPRSSQSSNQGPRTESPPATDKQIVGQLEQVYLPEPGFVYRARVDSGAETASMDARNVSLFERNGEEWVRFDIPHPTRRTEEPKEDEDDRMKAELVTLERPVERIVRIIQSSTDGYERRPVVLLKFMIGDTVREAEFTLANRSHLSHRMLIGRNILRDVMVIDVGQEYETRLPHEARSAPGARRTGEDE
ncbi:hypothetical protein C8D92_101410 [Tamilnaduibacter salinus]|uniref:Retropepsin-like aspartic endopeptidase domain-containing protein n=1 Tax=Tamilnaduibacter salinus TaxID=1484056 RepID=A0A2U1D1F6_9GAMM|nr:RimK/LysX family protein [Tamilnaduibacter salinus]PVY79200.1 hypothetical protein C8D92_101410 [Tamilnaduibacter salinus]